MLTPGVSCMKLRKLRPLLASPSITCSLNLVAASGRVVSMSGVSAVTVRLSCTAATWSCITMFGLDPTVTDTPSRTSVEKP